MLITIAAISASPVITGQLKKWHKITITFDGPQTSETADPNPFLDYRLKVTFTNGLKTYTIPGYFAADGDAANTGASSGNKWRVHFAPDETGTWNYTVSFRQGTNIAVTSDAGTAVTPLDGETGSFTIAATDKTGRDNRGKGRLQYVGEHYLRWAETGDYFVKGGADAPENFLAYEDFDNTPDNGNRRKSWSYHVQDWNSGDPTWNSGKGKGIIGAINYLASKGMNVFSFLTMNITGDDKNVFPYISDNSSDFTRFDCSKLDQWETVFEHADKKGMYLHFKTQETENDQLLNNGNIGIERKIYYRELIARFGHHLALNWNLGEENTQTHQQRRDMAQYFYDNDPYHHNIVIHTYPGDHDNVYSELIGSKSKLTGASIQTGWSNVHNATKTWVTASANAGKKWIVANDEQGSASTGVPPDLGYRNPDNNNEEYIGVNDRGDNISVTSDDIRHKTLWGNLMAGGAGVEYYFGYRLPQSDLTCQDYRSRDKMWDYTRHALEFFQNHLPFELMHCNDNLTSAGNDYCFALEGEIYAIYLPGGGSTNLDLTSYSSTFDVEWYDPRNGGNLQSGIAIDGGASVSIGTPPSNTSKDWVALVTVAGGLSGIRAVISATPISGDAPLTVSFDGSQSTGDNLSYSWNFGDQSSSSNTATDTTVEHTYQSTGQYTATLTVADGTVSRTSSVNISVIGFRAADDPSPAVNGLDYSYYEGTWTMLPDFGTLTAANSGTMNSFDISSFISLNYGVVFTGYVDVPQDGEYTFTTSSNDGTKLYIGDSLIVDNDGTHVSQEASGSIGLKTGKHAIIVEYFQAGGTQVLDVYYDGPGTGGKIAIPDNALFRSDEATALNPFSFSLENNKNNENIILYDIRGKKITSGNAKILLRHGTIPQGIYFMKDGIQKRIIAK
ncbi:MAG: DUF5060 domain-containing protein [Chitinivibrionales bacterium]|nr:DUF5060 domain-containing protein [Chitinivibrionales bacterium]